VLELPPALGLLFKLQVGAAGWLLHCTAGAASQDKGLLPAARGGALCVLRLLALLRRCLRFLGGCELLAQLQ
jgi:hypothetical protein